MGGKRDGHMRIASAIDLAATIAQAPTRATRSLKRTIELAAKADPGVVVKEIEARAQAELLDHPDFFADAAAWLGRYRHAGNR